MFAVQASGGNEGALSELSSRFSMDPNIDSAVAVPMSTESIGSTGLDPDSSNFSLRSSAPKRLGQNSSPSTGEITSISGQSVHSIAASARTSRRGSNASGDSFSLCELYLGADSMVERITEKKMLLDAHGRVCRRGDGGSISDAPTSAYPEVVLVHGYSGAGKTVLVRDTLKSKREHFYLEGKFDLHHRAVRPFAAIIDALSDLPRLLSEIDNGENIKRALIDAVGDDSDVITSVIPSMAQIFDHNTSNVVGVTDDSRSYSPEDRNRQRYMFRKLFRVVGSPSCPLVLFLDDLQWADEASLQLVENLATDDSNGSTLIVGTCRDNEVDDEHALVKMLLSVENRREQGVTNIFLGNLSDSEVNTLVSGALRATSTATKSLSDIIMSKTSGNPFFVTQFLLLLHREELIKFNLATLKWQWDEGGIMAKQVSANVSNLTKARLLGLSPKEQRVLTVAACLGNEFRKSVLALAMDSFDDSYDLDETLRVAVVNGILRPVDGISLYAFVHDQIQYAAFCLVPEEKRAAAQCRAGMSIIRKAPPDELVGDLLLVAVDLANCDALSFTASDASFKAELAMLNLCAGKQSLRIAAYAIAASYLEAGMALLDEDSFTNDYQLILDLYTLAAQAHYCNGNVERCNRCLDMVLERPLHIKDKLRGYLIRLTVLYVTNQHNKGMPLTKKVFEELGYNGFPRNVSTIAVMKDFLKTKRLVNKHKGRIAELPICTDKNRVIAMGILDVLAGICFFTDDAAKTLVVFRILRWSIKYGLSSHSGTGLVMYGVALCAIGDLRGGFEVGQIATAVSKRLKREHGITTKRMYIVESIYHHTRPVQLRVEPSLEIYEEAMRAGDTEGAMWALCQSSLYAWFSSMNLEMLDEKFMKTQSQIIYDYKIIIAWRALLPFRQTVLNLSGKSDDPLVLTGDAMEQENMLKDALDERNLFVSNSINSLRMELAYSFGEYESAAELLDELVEPEICYPGFYQGLRHKFFEGLTCLAMARGSKERSSKKVWMKRGMRCLRGFRKQTKAGNVNTLHVVYLLNAEVASARGNVKAATANYDKAISTASRNGFVQDKALAHERCAIFFLSHGDHDWASHHMNEAVKSYEYWGARRKVDYLSQAYPRLLAEQGG